MFCQVDGTEIADSGLLSRGVEENFCAEIRGMDDTYMILRRTDIGRVFKCDPRMSCFEEHTQHLAPELDCFHLFVEFDRAIFTLSFILRIPLFKGIAVEIVKIGDIVWAKERPDTPLAYSFDKE